MFFLVAGACFPLGAAHVKLTILATTDLHGNLYPVDYFSDKPANRGLAKIATLVRAARAANPNNLLVDCGDTIQGTPLEYVYQTFVRTGRLPLNLPFPGRPLDHDPMMLAMNALGYDAMVVGNHEYNFGLANLDRARADAHFPWLSANTVLTAPDGKPFARYLLKKVAGVKVAVVGITTPGIPSWERPENYARYRFEPAQEAVENTMAELRALPPDRRPDLILVAAHAGIDRGLDTADSGIPGENPTYEIGMDVPGIDAIVFGHTHRELAQLRLPNGVLLTQPKNWGMSLAQIDFELDSKPDGGWTVAGKSSHLIPVTGQTAPDEELLSIGRPYQEIAERYLNTAVAKSSEALSGRLGRVEDSALVDDIQVVQLHYAQADISFASLFNPRVTVPKGAVTVRQIAALYVYENDLYAIEGDGKMVKDALENAARYFLSCAGAACSKGPLINSHVIGFNFDIAQGVKYEIDLTKPEGERIRNLVWNGKPLAPAQKLRIAVNNYRYGGAAGYSMFKGARVLWRSSEDIRQLIINYFSERGELPSEVDNHWRIVPDEARSTLKREAWAEAPVYK